eukprot:TRINITY_DN51495_c0_g1_i1.p1 TRINITY_DN51495_c0_g1~~TRINITY_DN51495_c0_g1_i1.p1  ORF type:complete len:595 (+),score=64.37 TRINITY_DN51495_c0_g1_i1:41-1786(+)
MSDVDEDYYDEDQSDGEYDVEDDEINYFDEDDDNADDDTLREQDLLLEEMALVKNRGYNAGYIRHEVTLSVQASFPVSGFAQSHLRACGLDPERSVVVQLVFNQTPPVYLSACPQLKEITIRQSKDTNLDKGTLDDSVPFGLWWTLQQRLYEWLRREWDAMDTAAKGELARMNERNKEVKYRLVKKLVQNATDMGITGITEKVAYHILKRCNNQMENAQEQYLLDDVRRKEVITAANKAVWFKDTHEYSNWSVLLKIIGFLWDKILHCTETCLVCGVGHPLPLLKPVVCGQKLCNYQAIELKLGVNLENEITQYPEIVDFFICAAYSGAVFGKHFECPFEKEQVSKALQKCPEVATMAQVIKDTSKPSLQVYLKELTGEDHLYNVLHWVVSTNRSHLSMLSKNEQIDEMGTQYQFILNSTPPESEEAFQRLKRECKGSFYAFHGSPLGNWHSILRDGLKPKNYTTAYGPGIYMATNANTSFSYMKQAQAFPNSRFGKHLRVMALCEVADHGSKKECKKTVHRPQCTCNKGSPHYRVEAEEYTVTRLLFLWNESSEPKNGCESAKLKEKVDKIVAGSWNKTH